MQEIDDEFEVKLGRIGNRKAKRATSYLGRVRHEAQKGRRELAASLVV